MEKVSYFLKTFPRLNTHVYVTQTVELKTRFHMNTSMHYHYHARHIHTHTLDFGGESNWVLAHAQGCGHDSGIIFLTKNRLKTFLANGTPSF